MDMVGEAIEERTRETLALENARPFLKRKIRRDYGRAALVALAEDLKEQFRAGLREWYVTQFVNDEQFDDGELRLEF
jgi:hypothetical protein